MATSVSGKMACGLPRPKAQSSDFAQEGQGRTTHVSEEAQIRNLTPRVAPGRRLNERLSRSAALRTNARATENRVPHRFDRAACRRRTTTGGGRRALPQRAKWDDRRPKD